MLIRLYLSSIVLGVMMSGARASECRDSVRQAGKDFSDFSAYNFYLAHSTEHEALIPAIAQAVNESVVLDSGQFRFLDYGSGDAPILRSILSENPGLRSQIEVSFIEPANTRFAAESAMLDLGVHVEESAPELSESFNGFNFILASHVFYYVDPTSVEELYSRLAPGGVLAIAIADTHTGSEQISSNLFREHSRPRNQYGIQDLMQIIAQNNWNYSTQLVESEFAFEDTQTNRIKAATFIFGSHLETFPREEILASFEAYKDKNRIVLPIHDRLILIQKP